MKRILTFLFLLSLFTQCYQDIAPISLIPQPTVATQPEVACDFSNGRPEITVQLTPVGKLSQAREGMAVASTGTKILFAGAFQSYPSPSSPLAGSGSTTVDIYDIVTHTWSTAKLSKWRYSIAAVASGNKVFFAGGRVGVGDPDSDQLFATVDIYDVSTNTWSVASLSEPRAAVGAAAVGNKVFFAGGEKSGSYDTSNQVDIYDLSTGTWSATRLSESRAYIAAVTADDKIYFAGGHIDYRWYAEPSSAIDIYDNQTNSWTTSRLEEPKAMFSGIAVKNKIYWAGSMIGSVHGGAPVKSICAVEIRDISTQTSSVDYLSKPGHWVPVDGQNAVLKDNKILYFRHYDTADPVRFDIYDTVTQSWSIGVLPKSILGASVISVNNTVYIAGGRVNGAVSNQVWKLDF